MTLEVDIPDGVSGNWRVESFTVTDEDVRKNVRGLFRPSEYVPAGTYKRLMRGKVVVMSNTPMEIETNSRFIRAAKGRVLINGLGLGMVLAAILKKPNVEHVTVVEKSPDVIKLVGPSFAQERVTIIEADALEWKPGKTDWFDVVWHDIWDYITADNLEDMHKLHRRYARKTKWQDSWARSLCERARSQSRRSWR